MGIVAGIVRDAVARNELAMAESLTPEENTKEFMNLSECRFSCFGHFVITSVMIYVARHVKPMRSFGSLRACCKRASASVSICRTRSRVNPSSIPISLSV